MNASLPVSLPASTERVPPPTLVSLAPLSRFPLDRVRTWDEVPVGPGCAPDGGGQ